MIEAMNEYEFEILDNDKRNYSGYSLERLKALAPTLPERSRQRLACMELIAERERMIANAAIRTAARRSMQALVLAMVSLVVSVSFAVVFPILYSQKQADQPKKPSARPTASPTPDHSMSTPEPLPPLFSAPPAAE
jgi:hypothetical protein